MAKRQRTDYGSFDFDTDLDFDFDFDEAKSSRSNKNRNKPIDHVADGVKSAMKSKFTDPYHIRNMVRKALPDGFSQAWEVADVTVENSRELYDEATKELKPHLAGIARKLDNLTPDSMSRTKRFLQALRDKVSPEIPAHFQMQQQSMEDQGIQRMFAELELQKFQVEDGKRKNDQARQIVSDRVAGKRFDSQQKLLGIIANESSATRRFLTTYNISYQKKSLELQYRTYAATAGMAKAFGQYVHQSRKFQDALLLNTSLPEYAKTSNVQRWKQISKEQVFGNVNKSIFGGSSRIGNAVGRIKKRGKEKLSEYKDIMSMIEDGLEMAIDSRDMDRDMAEMEGRKSSGYRTAGAFGGDMLAEMISDMISGKVKNIASKNKGFMKRSFRTGKHALNPGGLFESVRNAKWFKDLGADGGEAGELTKNILGGLMSLLSEGGPDMTIKNTSIGSLGEDKLHTQMRVARSLTSVIPGYLARILREVTIARTGNTKLGLLTYDSKTDSFKSEKAMARDLASSLRTHAGSSLTDQKSYAEEVNSTYQSFMGKTNASAGQGTQVKAFLAKLSRSKDDFGTDGASIKRTKEFKALPPDVQKIVSTILDERFTGDSFESEGNQFRLAHGISKTRGSIGNLMGPIQEMMRDGHGKLLEKNGVIKRNKDGDWDVNEEAYYRFFDDTIGTSDVNMKTNISKSIDGKKALNGFKNTNTYSYNYKGGKGLPGGLAFGPMAQDVRSKFGNKAAPGGKSIDFLNLSGYQTAAIKQMSEMLESMGAGNGIEYLRDISETLHRMEGGSGIGGSGGGNSASGLWGHAGALGAGLLKNAGKSGSSMIRNGARMIRRAGRVGKSIAGSKAVKSAGTIGANAAISAALAATRMGSELLFNTLPAGIKSAQSAIGGAKSVIKNLFQKTKDVYIAGRESPALEAALIEAGFYYDQATSTVIKSMDDIAKAKGNIVDAAGKVRLSIEDRARGIFDGSGDKIKSFASAALEKAAALGGFMLGKAGAALGNAIPMGKAFLNKLGGAGSAIGGALGKLRLPGMGMDPRLFGVVVQIRDLIAMDKTGPRVLEILSRDLEKESNLKVMNTQALKAAAAGAFDQIKGLFGGGGNSGGFVGPMPPSAGNAGFVGPMPNTSGGGIGGILGGMGGLLGAGAAAAGGLFSAGKGMFNRRLPGMSGRIGGWRDGIRNSRAGGWGRRGMNRMSNLATRGRDAFSRFSGMFNGQGNDGNGGQGQPAIDETATNTYSAGSHASRLAQLLGDKATRGYRSIKGMFGDGNGDGQRDGGLADRAADNEAQKIANEERKRAGIEASQKGADAKSRRNSPADNAIEAMIAMATKGLGAIAGAAGDIFGAADDLLSGGGDEGPDRKRGRGRRGRGRVGRAGKVGKVGRMGRVGGSILNGIRNVGSGAMNIASKIPGAAKVARVGMMATRAAQVVGLMGGSAGAMLGTAASAISSAISAPVVIGALAVAGVAYGGYKLYKYLVRNNIDDYQRIRVLQYGLDGTDVTKAYNSKVLGLENYLLDGKLSFSGGIATINARTTNPDEIRELFDIAKEDSDTSSKFASWYENRFRPTFLHHVNKLYTVDNKASLKDVASLKPDALLEYLGGAEVSGIWEYTKSPFKGLDVLSNNPQPAKELISAKTKEVSAKLQEKAKNAIKSGAIAPKGDAAKAANSVISSAIPSVAAAATTGTVMPQRKETIPANSSLGRAMASGQLTQPGMSEDGRGADTGGGQSTTSMSFGGMSGLKVAGGPLADGSQGMQYVKLGKDAVLEGLNPRMKQQFLAMAQEYGQSTGKSILVNEAFRSYKRQEALWKQNPGKAARPGGSMHEFGLALDINTGIMSELEKMGLLRKYGFTRPVIGETWHMEPAGVQSDIQRAKKDPAWADQAIQASLGRGGGGAGSTPNSRKGGRNPAMAKAIFEAAGESKVELSAQGANSAAPGAAGAPVLPGPKLEGMSSSDGPNTASIMHGGKGYASAGRGMGAGGAGNSSGDFSGSLGGNHGDIKSLIAKSAQEAGADPNEMMLMAAMESGLDPNAKAKKSSAAGLNQFIDGTWNEQVGKHGAKYGIGTGDRMDPRASTIMAAEYMKSNNARIQKAKGSPLDMTDKYMGHMFGAGGASTLMRADPNSSAAQVLPDAAAKNREIFYDGGRARTVMEVRQLLENRLKTKAKAFGIQFPGSGAPAYNVQGTAESSISLDKVPYNPSSPKPMSASPSSSYELPGNTPVMYTSKSDSSTRASGVGFDAPSPSRVPSMGGLGGAPAQYRDVAVQATSELFARLQSSTESQIQHLSAIDTNTGQMVELLKTIAENSSGGKAVSGSAPAVPDKPADTPRAPSARTASSSSFDNRRVIVTA